MSSSQFAVIGHPIAHTMSPFIHARLFALSGRPARYGILDIPPEELSARLPRLRELDGFNITIPHKQTIIPFLDSLDEKAALFHSVNTVKNEGGRLTGFTTDGAGFCRALETAGVALSGRVVILGAGGAARPLAFEAARHGGRVTVAARAHSMEAARRLCAELEAKVSGANAGVCPIDAVEDPAELLVNATPAGMYPNTGACPVPEDTVRGASCVFDAVYNPGETALLRLARENGVQAVGGMDMLVWQAAAAHEIWYGARFDPKDIGQLCADAAFELKKQFGNVVLCGFMGSGKTTVGRVLARKLGRAFIDMDQWIEERQGMTVSEIFARHGEAEFRRMERDAARDLGRQSGLVVAAGGGALVDPKNAAEFRRNGVVMHLDAGLPSLRARLEGSKSRPMIAGASRGEQEEKMERLYRARADAYRAAADFSVPADDLPEPVAGKIQELLSGGEPEKN